MQTSHYSILVDGFHIGNSLLGVHSSNHRTSSLSIFAPGRRSPAHDLVHCWYCRRGLGSIIGSGVHRDLGPLSDFRIFLSTLGMAFRLLSGKARRRPLSASVAINSANTPRASGSVRRVPGASAMPVRTKSIPNLPPICKHARVWQFCLDEPIRVCQGAERHAGLSFDPS